MIGASNDAAIGFESEFAELHEGVVRLIGQAILIAIVEEKGKAIGQENCPSNTRDAQLGKAGFCKSGS